MQSICIYYNEKNPEKLGKLAVTYTNVIVRYCRDTVMVR